jgi:hypothetical protein
LIFNWIYGIFVTEHQTSQMNFEIDTFRRKKEHFWSLHRFGSSSNASDLCQEVPRIKYQPGGRLTWVEFS